MDELFGKEGCLHDILPLYEYRRQQSEMARFIDESISEGGVTFIEAGTGTGKTIAYLIPALAYCLREGKILAISTETKTLQKQLIDKDIPILQKVFQEHFQTEFRYSLCLGSANYPCVRRYELLIQRGGFLFNEQNELGEIARLIESGTPFTRFDLQISTHLWREIERDPDMCRGMECPQSKSCPFQRAKKEWFSSHILIMNHYLFFSNIAAGKTYLPKFDCVVFDEAHSVEQIASQQLGFELSYPLLIDILERFHHRNKKMLLPMLSQREHQNSARSLFYEIEKEGKYFFEALFSMAGEKRSVRVKRPFGDGSSLSESLGEFIEILLNAHDDFSEEPALSEYESAMSKIQQFKAALDDGINCKSNDQVIWIEKSESTGNAYLCGAPTDVGLIMSNDVYETYESVFFVSATLAIHGDFSFIQQRLGAFESNTLSLDSPFDFESRVSLYIPDDLPLPQDRGFVDAAVERTASLIEMTDGNCLILFTSYEMLKDFSVRLRSMTKVPLYVQGELDPARAVSEYVDNPGGVLLGTHSFWQGLDLPGNLLKCVIITKLPFPVPDRPDVEARCEILESKGVNAFTGYHLPSAVIQFKQGFGRLMRRSDDAGVVAVFDGRIRTKGYGRHFIESLPKCRISDSVRDLSRFIERTFVF